MSSSEGRGAPRDDDSRRRLERRLRAAMITLGVALTLNNLLPYVGLRDDSCQTMFSSLAWWEHGNNHLFMPQRMLSDLWAYRYDVEATLQPPPEGYGRARDLERWLKQPNRALNTEALRVVLRQLCDRGHRVSLTWTDRRGPDRRPHRRSAPDACADPSLSSPHGWIPVRLYETDFEVP